MNKVLFFVKVYVFKEKNMHKDDDGKLPFSVLIPQSPGFDEKFFNFCQVANIFRDFNNFQLKIQQSYK